MLKFKAGFYSFYYWGVEDRIVKRAWDLESETYT